MKNIYQQHLDKVPANFEALTPLHFMQRAAGVYPAKTAVVYGDLRRNWRDVYQRCCQFASALVSAGIG